MVSPAMLVNLPKDPVGQPSPERNLAATARTLAGVWRGERMDRLVVRAGRRKNVSFILGVVVAFLDVGDEEEVFLR